MNDPRGAVLLEILLSIALFVGTAAFALSSLRMTTSRLSHATRMQRATEFAASKLAELEAGVIALEDLRDGVERDAGSQDLESESEWSVSVHTSPTPYGSLTLVELTVSDANDDSTPRATARRIMRLRDYGGSGEEP